MRISWPLIGRDAEFRRIRELVVKRNRGVVLAGPAGAGKTRLAMECLQWAETSGFVTAQVTGTRTAQSLPFGALAPLLPNVHHDDTPGVDSLADYLRRSAAALVERAGGGRLLLMVDDAHLLDGASSILLHQLATGGQVFVLATVRTPEPAPDPIVALWKDELLERVEIGPLDDDSVDVLLSSALGSSVERRAVTRFAARSAGNVMFLRELVIGALDDGTLRDDGGIWRLVGPLSPSNRLVELVEARLGGLAPTARELLEVLSFGEPLGPAEIEALTDPALVETLERRGIVSSRQNGQRLEIRLDHPTYGEVVRYRVPTVRARVILRSLADVVESTGARRREDTLRIGTWRLGGGGGNAELLLAAANTARWRYDFPLAERLAKAALDAGAGFEATLLTARLAGLQGRSDEAEELLAKLATEAKDDTQRGSVAISRLDNLSFWLGQTEEGIRIAREAEAGIADPTWRDEIAARRSGIISGIHGAAAGAEAAEPLLARAEGRGLVLAAIFGGYSFVRTGRLAAAQEAADRGHAAHLALAGPLEWDPCMHRMFQCEALAEWGRFGDSEHLAEDEYRRALTEGNTEAQGWFAWTLGRWVGERGHVDSAVRYQREAVAIFRQLGRPQMVKFCLTSLTMALALGRQADEAAEALAAIDGLDLPESVYSAVDLLHARAWTAVAAGDVLAAGRFLDEAVALGERSGELVAAATALHSRARLGHPDQALDGLAALAPRIDGELVQARLSHVRSLVEEDPEGLEDASLAFESMGALLLAAEAIADAAVAWRRKGRPRQGAVAQRRTNLLAGRCDAATPALQTLDARAQLTPAERDAAVLAAAGHSNKEIAGKLGRSVRTVENTLQHAYQKLGISSRAQLAESLEGTS